MRIKPFLWLTKLGGVKSGLSQAAAADHTAWTIPKTPIEVLAHSLRTDGDWQIAADRVHRRGIEIIWKRSISGRSPGVTLRIDGQARRISLHEGKLLVRSVRARLRPAAAPSAAHVGSRREIAI
jgi:hypothetical protein